MRYTSLTPEEAAELIHDGDCIGMSGFTNAGAPKVMPTAIAQRAKAEHAAGRPFKLTVMTGASTSTLVDGVLAEAGAVERFMPYQASKEMRRAINAGEVQYIDCHISLMAQDMRYGHLPRISTAIIEVCDVTDDGEITLTASGGNSPTFCMLADRIILELNTYHKPEIREIHDIYVPLDPPDRGEIAVYAADSRVGTKTLRVDPAKIVGIVHTHRSDGIPAFKPSTGETDIIGERIADFLAEEYRIGRIPPSFLPIQSGVGNVANAVLTALARNTSIPNFKMYTEVIQDSAIDLIRQGRCSFASGCSLSVSDQVLEDIYEHFDFYRDKLLLRPQEVTNNPEMARNIGLICTNTAIEIDIFGNVNSSHFFGTTIMNGIGGSGDFARAAAYTIFMCPSTAKGGAISSIVPMVSHTDHTEHDVAIVVTEQGIADLRGRSPRERAELIIENCAHPSYRPLLRRYLALTPTGHTPHCLKKAFAMHIAYQDKGDMHEADI
ncbi:MAG TPA: succinate CoA transferase [Candidatus Akkermansia intestinavium]|nr:succinate CoA transferase [Candidatus Akkermansia intestinavium]